ncbi:MAG TPA: hypothetical protein VGO58_02760 [Chitinophagaceae bacterium]|nr:hypothetical protein [Chitinophagaceae bacterium]
MGNKTQLDSQDKLKDLENNEYSIKEFAGDQKEKQDEISKEITRCLRIQNKKLLEQVAFLKQRLKTDGADKTEINARLNYLVKLNHDLSEALGSCNKCWGEDPGCADCSGNGSPGWRTVNKRLFYLYVLPTLERLYGGSK